MAQEVAEEVAAAEPMELQPRDAPESMEPQPMEPQGGQEKVTAPRRQTFAAHAMDKEASEHASALATTTPRSSYAHRLARTRAYPWSAS